MTRPARDERTSRFIVTPPEFASPDRRIDRQLRSVASQIEPGPVLEQGGTVMGMVPLEDSLEKRVGSIKDEHDD